MVKLLIDKTAKPNNDYLITNSKTIGNEYNCRTINPPFFTQIVIMDLDVVEYDLKRIYNMCIVDKNIFFPEKYKSFFESLTTVQLMKDDNCYYCTKPNNKIFTFPSKRIVEFIIIGVQRGGTTALAHNLSKHKEIYIDGNLDPRKSEIHFFDLNWSRCNDWYKKHFDYKFQMVGDKTPDLFSLSYTFPMIQKINPFVKLIVTLKDPILRAYSSWKMTSSNFGETRSFEECVKHDMKDESVKTFYTLTKNYLFRGLYYKQLKKLERWFPKQNILVLFSENVLNNPEQEYEKIYEFLNVGNVSNNYKRIHVSENKTPISKETYNLLIDYYSKDVANLEEHLNVKLNWLTPK